MTGFHKVWIMSAICWAVVLGPAVLVGAANTVVVVPLGGKSNPSLVPKTGQTSCWDSGYPTNCEGTGQDGDLQMGVSMAPRYVNNENGTVTDRLTGLIWLRDGNCIAFFFGDTTGQNQRPWKSALDAAKKLSNGYCGLSDGSVAGDWRLPNIKELLSLVEYNRLHPSIDDEAFPNTAVYNYWTSSWCMGAVNFSWVVHLYDGAQVYQRDQLNSYCILPVRGGQK